jgi:hypothetical protein
MPALWAANSVGDRVPACARGKVHSVFARACNIEMSCGGLVTLLAPELGAAPHGIRLQNQAAPFDAWLRSGNDAILADGLLQLPQAGVDVDLAGATLWTGAVARVPRQSAAAAIRLRQLRAIVFARAPRPGIAAAVAQHGGHANVLDRAFSARLVQTLGVLARATDRCDIDAIAAAAARLVGLGPGLTPAGDDFLTGYLAALWSRAGSRQWHAATLAAALAPFLARTHAISRQMLDDAANGRFAQALVDVIIALSGAGDIDAAAARALACGHSSGADALCGLMFGYAPAVLETKIDAARIAAAA